MMIHSLFGFCNSRRRALRTDPVQDGHSRLHLRLIFAGLIMTDQSPLFAPLADTIDEALSSFFGFDDFRKGQRQVIEAVVDGRDNVVVMPTGSGKSLCYMLPALVIPGLVVAVSPLIALMKDQAEALDAFGIPATFINSALSWPEQRERLQGIQRGDYKIVLIAPERFRSDVFNNAIADLPIGLFAIDEAHCISQWGHDFRPDYLTLDEARRQLGEPTTLALTATATPAVQRDIADQLDLEDPQILVSGFSRPNLFFEVYSSRGQSEKYDRLHAALGRVDEGVSLVYCATRKQVRKVSEKLKQRGHHPAIYHGGMRDERRDAIQDAFMAGDVPLLIATNAFGMGVDKSDVRLIVHFNIPGSVEAYYQEAGRAGRDGDDAHCLLLYNRSDRGIHEFFIDNSYPERSLVEEVWSDLRRRGSGTHPIDAEQLADHLDRGPGRRTHPWAVESALRLLERGGHVAFGTRHGTPWLEVLDQARTRELRVDWQALDDQRDLEYQHLDHITRYATGHRCRQNYLVGYFQSQGEDESCGHCDICCGPPDYAPITDARITITDPLDILTKKLLSGVARCRGGWGTHVVAGMLRGSTSKKILRAGLDKRSTYGLLSELRQRDLVRLLDQLLHLRLTRQDTHGCLHLTDRGSQIMTSSDPLPSDIEQTLLRHVDPLGQSLDDADLERLQDTDLSDTYLKTLGLLRDGLAIKAIAEKRGLTPNSILRHLLTLAHHGHHFELDFQPDPDLIAQLKDIAGDWAPGDPIKPLKEALPDTLTYRELKLHLTLVIMERQAITADAS